LELERTRTVKGTQFQKPSFLKKNTKLGSKNKVFGKGTNVKNSRKK